MCPCRTTGTTRRSHRAESNDVALSGAVTSGLERLKLSVLRQKNGINSALDVLDAQRELFSAQQSLLQAQLLQLNN